MEKTPTWDFLTVTVCRIDPTETCFNWFPGNLSEDDVKSLEQNGILIPILLQVVPGKKYRIIDGFKRISWLTSNNTASDQKQQETPIPCFILPESIPEREATNIRLETLSTSSGNFSGIQIGRVLKQFQDSDFTTEEIAAQVLPRLGLKPSARLVRQLLDLHNVLKTMTLPESLLQLGSEDLLPLLKFSQSALPDLAALSERMEVGGKKWRNLLQVLDEVSRLREMSADEVLKLPEILEIIGRSSLQAPLRYRLLKQQLDTWRYPELSDLRQRFEQGRQRLNLSPRITLESDPYFENDDLTLSFKISSVQELRKNLKVLANTVPDIQEENSEDIWKELFALLQED
ncbi:MAG: hypothetical protein HOM71_07315 [Deltaproteobacteria bacterium]|jgi:hypothetical protein|nr:hypothetical protein [Deltaproteobacteria bacterium]MBT5087277.1 hypothetical protein [Deltaproteobacteria bacterium]